MVLSLQVNVSPGLHVLCKAVGSLGNESVALSTPQFTLRALAVASLNQIFLPADRSLDLTHRKLTKSPSLSYNGYISPNLTPKRLAPPNTPLLECLDSTQVPGGFTDNLGVQPLSYHQHA